MYCPLYTAVVDAVADAAPAATESSPLVVYAAGSAASTYIPISESLLTIWVLTVMVAEPLDNVVRPVLIRMGADLPLLLIFSGVVGGLLAFGLVGIFIGPVVLAVAYRRLQAWVAEQEPPAPG